MIVRVAGTGGVEKAEVAFTHFQLRITNPEGLDEVDYVF